MIDSSLDFVIDLSNLEFDEQYYIRNQQRQKINKKKEIFKFLI